MIIAVNTRFLIPGNLEGYGHFLQEILQRITVSHPEHQFLFIFDRPYSNGYNWGPNVRSILIGPPARHPLLWKLWYDVKIPAVLRKFKADVFVSADGFCSLRTKVPQCLVVHDLAFLHYPAFNKRTHLFYYKRYTPKFLAKAGSLVTVSEFSKKDIITQYDIQAEKITVIYNGVRNSFKPLGVDEREAVKRQYTGGAEYFMYGGAIHPRKNLITLLKAFSLFKKRQQTGMKLVIAGRLAWHFGSFLESLKSYKYRKDVILTGYLPNDEFSRLTAGAYAMVYPSLFEGFGLPVIEAMKAEVPVITSSGTAMEEIAGDAALLANPHEQQSIASQMMLLYKDEQLRKQLIEKGKQRSLDFSWDQAAIKFWEVLVALSKKEKPVS